MPHFNPGDVVRYRTDHERENEDAFACFFRQQRIDARELVFVVVRGNHYLQTVPENLGYNWWNRFELVTSAPPLARKKKASSKFKQFMKSHSL